MDHSSAIPETTPNEPHRGKLALSPSRAADYRQCPLKYRLRSIDRITEPPTVAMVKGTLVHAVLEEMHGKERAERTFPGAVGRLRYQWGRMCQRDNEIGKIVPEDSLYDFLSDCRELLRSYFYMENPQGFDATACEKYVSTVLPNGVPVRGFIDRVDVAPTGEIRVVDYKTGKKPQPRYSHDAYFQMRFYALVWWHLTGTIPDLLRLMYLKTRSTLDLQPTRAELEYLELDIRQLWSAIEADGREGTFHPKRSALCKWCYFKNLCPEYGGQPPAYPGWPGTTEGSLLGEPGPQ